jgi:dephospho-CoA kinase
MHIYYYLLGDVMKIIGFCGLPGSGKTTAIDAIRNMGVVISMGDVIRNELKNRGMEATDDNLGKIAKEIRKVEGDDTIARKCVDIIKKLESDIVFIDGLRSTTELDVFREFWKMPLIAIISEDSLRYKRIAKRSRLDDSNSTDQMRLREKREVNFGLNHLIEIADYRVDNDASINKLQNNTKKLVKQIIANY